MTLEYLTEHGIITNWDDMGQAWYQKCLTHFEWKMSTSCYVALDLENETATSASFSSSLLKRDWSFLMESQGKEFTIGNDGAETWKYFACIMTVLKLQRRAGIHRCLRNHLQCVDFHQDPCGKMFSLGEPLCILGFGVMCRRRGQLCLRVR